MMESCRRRRNKDVKEHVPILVPGGVKDSWPVSIPACSKSQSLPVLLYILMIDLLTQA